MSAGFRSVYGRICLIRSSACGYRAPLREGVMQLARTRAVDVILV